ncbi:Tn3 family transposase [Streptomyces sp. NPDC091272]|uniref:Tn3 family transposase n=1 Tax=Streptomyces sp. NPDC091272 TaxID=3365981 RepID=UPI00381CFA30
MLWHTRYLDAVVTVLHEAGTEVQDEYLARLSPLKARHLNVLGRYSFLPALPNGGMLSPPCATRPPPRRRRRTPCRNRCSPPGPRRRRAGSVSGFRKLRRSRDGFRWFVPGGLT